MAKENIHPNYKACSFTCSCGNVINTHSTLCKNDSIDVCSKCHPFYTGTQKIIDTGGRVERFKRQYASFNKTGNVKS